MTVWTVPAEVIKVVDGDTLKLRLDLGWHITLETNVRVVGIDTPEMNTPAGRQAKLHVVDVLNETGMRVTFVSEKLDKYGRPLGAVLLPDGRNLALILLSEKHAIEYGGGRRA